MKTFTTFAALLILLAAGHPKANAALKTVALLGDTAPGTSDSFTSFFNPVLNNAGQTAFRGVLNSSSTTDRGIWSEGGGSGLALVAREGNTAPGTSDNFTFLGNNLVLNNAGQTAFLGRLDSSLSTNSGIWSEGGGSGLALVARGNYSDLSLNNVGQMAFRGVWDNGGRFGSTGIFSDGGGSGLALVAGEGERPDAPGTMHRFDSFDTAPVFNNAGQTAFRGDLNIGIVNGLNRNGIWSEGGGSGLALVAREGNTAPGTSDSFVNFHTLSLNNAGQTAFLGSLNSSSDTNFGIWAEDQLGVLTLIAREGDLLDVDDGPGTDFRTIRFLSFNANAGNTSGRSSGFNDLGQLAFSARFTDGTSGVFVSDLVAIPEPTSLVLGALGLFGLLATRRRRK